jgi:hypothetical protein
MSPLDRRDFLGALGAAAAAGPLRTRTGHAGDGQVIMRIALFHEPGFPVEDGAATDAWLAEVTAGLDVTALDADGLSRLPGGGFDVLLTTSGSTFPKAAWRDLFAYLNAGGNWVHVGGVPFAVPVVREDGAWRAEARQTNYHKRLGLTHAFPVDARDGRVTAPWLDAAGIIVERAFAPYWRFTRTKSVPTEDGSDGVREAELTALAMLEGADGTPLAAPVIQVDRTRGPLAGGRWILLPFQGRVSAENVRRLLEHASGGVQRLRVQPNWACYRPGEVPTFTVTVSTPRHPRQVTLTVRLDVTGPDGRLVGTAGARIAGADAERTAQAEMRTRRPLAPGFYRVRANVEPPSTGVGHRELPNLTPVLAETGFWVRDERLLASGGAFTTDDFTLVRDGRPYPAAGTTYMASDVHRQFLFEPNPAVWDRDMAAMKAAGATIIRTGIWTGWRRYMPEEGAVDEAVLRAFEAFVLTAKRHDLPVIFTFFAFIPETWGGANAYLDPAAIRAQSGFLRAFAERVATVPDLVWDLINEPTFCNPERLWQCRPNFDEHERRAWSAWLRERYPAATDAAHAARLQELWRALPGESLGLPPLEEFGDRNLWEAARPLRTTAYRLFAQEQFARWARTMRDLLKGIAPRQLVMVGQDEGGTGESPSNHTMAEAVDLTSIHTWWLNDDLVWDHVVTKAPRRPNLAQETGIMFVETLDARAWRTEHDSAALLERKLAIALGVGGGGYLEWIWDLNTTMPLDNESTIGLVRPDGSRKPEFAVWSGVSRFAASLRDLGPREAETVAMVVPHHDLWSSRNTATEATKRAVRAMHYHCRVPMTGVSELGLQALGRLPALVVVPSPRVLSDQAWSALTGWMTEGATVLVTGPFEADEYWRPVRRLSRWDAGAVVRPVAQREELRVGDVTVKLSFRGDRQTRVEKAAFEDDAAPHVARFPLGRGALLFAPIPVELAHEEDAAAVLYRHALAAAGLVAPVEVEDDDPGVLVHVARYGNASLFTVVSEMGRPRDVRWRDRESGARFEVRLASGRAALVLAERRSGRVLARYGGT